MVGVSWGRSFLAQPLVAEIKQARTARPSAEPLGLAAHGRLDPGRERDFMAEPAYPFRQ